MVRKLVSFDWAMKKLLRSKANYEILEGFLSELLNDDIKIIEILESESNMSDELDKYSRVDLLVKNNKDEHIIIEVQYERTYNYLKRILYNTSKHIVDYMKLGEDYSKVVKVISINILYFELGHGEDYVYHGTTEFKGIHKNDLLQLSEKQREIYGKSQIKDIYPEYYLIRVNNFDDIAKTPLDEWIYFLKNGEIKSEFKARGIKKAGSELEIMKLSSEERRAYERYMRHVMDEESVAATNFKAGELEGIKKGIEKGIELGEKKIGRAHV